MKPLHSVSKIGQGLLPGTDGRINGETVVERIKRRQQQSQISPTNEGVASEQQKQQGD